MQFSRAGSAEPPSGSDCCRHRGDKCPGDGRCRVCRRSGGPAAVVYRWTLEASGSRHECRAHGCAGRCGHPEGDRRLLLPLAVAGGAYYYLRRGRRPSWFQVAALVAATMFLVITPLREARTGQVGIGEAFVQGLQNPGAAIEGLLISQDTSQLSVLAVMISEVGDGRPIPWQWGMSTLTETVLQPIPRQVWEDKPSPIRTQFIEYNWGMAGGRCVSQCPTFQFSAPSTLTSGRWASRSDASFSVGSHGFGTF